MKNPKCEKRKQFIFFQKKKKINNKFVLCACFSVNLDSFTTAKMVRSLSQWTKTLSFPHRHSKECNVNVHPIQAPPTPARNKTNNSSPSSSPPNSPSNVPITEISQIVSFFPLLLFLFLIPFDPLFLLTKWNGHWTWKSFVEIKSSVIFNICLMKLKH